MPYNCFSLTPVVLVALLVSISTSLCDKTLDAVENGHLTNKKYLRRTSLSSHPLLSDQLSKLRNCCQ